MPLPIDLVLVRHGESESNLANSLDRKGDSRYMTEAHKSKHTSEYRLTNKGIKQAKAAGQWLRKNIDGQFDFYLTSDFARAKETAAYLDLPGAEWEIDPYLVERDHGEMDGLSNTEKEVLYGKDYRNRYIHNFYRRPPNGESRLDLSLRWDRIMLSLSQRHAEHRVIIVAHQSIIESGLIRRLHWTIEDFHNWKKKRDPKTDINNCQIIHFTRRNPETGQVIERIRWWRTVCPWDKARSDGKWRPIIAKKYTSKELLKMVQAYERLIGK